MGRSLLCAPYFSTVVLAANALMHSGDDAAKNQHLPGIASGDTIATLAFTEDNGRWDESGITMVATAAGDGWSLNGHKMYVLDGHVANLIIVAARTGKGVSLFTVDADAAGLSRTALQTMDQTPQAGPARVRQHAGHAARARTVTVGKCSSGCSTSRRSRSRPNRSGAPRSVST